jgi:hypothetical protein
MQRAIKPSCSSCIRGARITDERVACGASFSPDEQGRRPIWAVRKERPAGLYMLLAGIRGANADDMPPHDGERCELWKLDPEKVR